MTNVSNITELDVDQNTVFRGRDDYVSDFTEPHNTEEVIEYQEEGEGSWTKMKFHDSDLPKWGHGGRGAVRTAKILINNAYDWDAAENHSVALTQSFLQRQDEEWELSASNIAPAVRNYYANRIESELEREIGDVETFMKSLSDAYGMEPSPAIENGQINPDALYGELAQSVEGITADDAESILSE